MSTLKEQARKAFEEEVIHTRSHSDERDANGLYLQEGLQTAWRNFYAGYQSASESAPWLSQIAKSKIDQMAGSVCGVLVRNEAGALAAVSDMGRVTWLGEPEMGPVEYSGAEIESIKQRAEAWLGLTELLDELAPEWRGLPGTGRESAFSAIRSLKQSAQAPEPIIPNGGYTVERHGNGYAIYRGRTMEHHGENLGHLTECLPHLPDMIEKALNAPAQAPASGEVDPVENLPLNKGEFVGAKITVGLAESVSLDWATDMVAREAREVSVPDVFDDVVKGKPVGHYLVVFNTELDYADDDCAGSAFEIPHAIRVIPTHPPASQVPEGFALVPESMCLSYEDIESIITMTGWDEGRDDFGEGVLWVGTLKDDDGNETYGLHISCIEVMEEGALPVQEFKKPAVTTPGNADTGEAWIHKSCGGRIVGRMRDGDTVTCEKCGKAGSVLVDDGGTDIEWFSPPTAQGGQGDE